MRIALQIARRMVRPSESRSASLAWPHSDPNVRRKQDEAPAHPSVRLTRRTGPLALEAVGIAMIDRRVGMHPRPVAVVAPKPR
jgi:hypothetical protein